MPRATTIANLTEIINRIESAGAAPVLIGFDNGLLGAYDKDFQSLANQKHIAYVPDVMAGIFDHQNLLSDPIHPNDAGYAIMAAKISPIVKSILQ